METLCRISSIILADFRVQCLKYKLSTKFPGGKIEKTVKLQQKLSNLLAEHFFTKKSGKKILYFTWWCGNEIKMKV